MFNTSAKQFSKEIIYTTFSPSFCSLITLAWIPPVFFSAPLLFVVYGATEDAFNSFFFFCFFTFDSLGFSMKVAFHCLFSFFLDIIACVSGLDHKIVVSWDTKILHDCYYHLQWRHVTIGSWHYTVVVNLYKQVWIMWHWHLFSLCNL